MNRPEFPYRTVLCRMRTETQQTGITLRLAHQIPPTATCSEHLRRIPVYTDLRAPSSPSTCVCGFVNKSSCSNLPAHQFAPNIFAELHIFMIGQKDDTRISGKLPYDKIEIGYW